MGYESELVAGIDHDARHGDRVDWPVPAWDKLFGRFSE